MATTLRVTADARPDFSVRCHLPERMDADDLPPATYAAVLADLARANSWTFARPPTLRWLAGAVRHARAFSLVDVGFGHGDMLRAIARWARRRGLTARLAGVDLNPKSAPVARAATDPALGITYFSGDAADIGFAPDFIVSSLVAHHMDDAEIVSFVKWMEATARRGWFINDLHRHPLAWGGFAVLATIMRWHPIVRHDGMLSVRRAFRRADWQVLLAAAGIDQSAVTLRWQLPFRLCVGRVR